MNIPFYQFKVLRLDNTNTDLSICINRVVLVVNTASRCGYSIQYAGLEELYKTYVDRGLLILGFPCNQFACQEPKDGNEISEFCQMVYGVTFPMFAKIAVNGKKAHPLYQYIKAAAPGIWGTQAIKWNFTKFLINRQGQVIKRFAPFIKPKMLASYIENLL